MGLLGYDVIYFRGQKDEQLMEIALREGRTIITRDTHLALERDPVHSFHIKTIDFRNQLQAVTEAFPLDFNRTFLSRCTHCNVPTERVSRQEVIDELPPKAKEWASVFFRCPGCGKLYWDGTHIPAMLRRLKEDIGLEIDPVNWHQNS